MNDTTIEKMKTGISIIDDCVHEFMYRLNLKEEKDVDTALKAILLLAHYIEERMKRNSNYD